MVSKKTNPALATSSAADTSASPDITCESPIMTTSAQQPSSPSYWRIILVSLIINLAILSALGFAAYQEREILFVLAQENLIPSSATPSPASEILQEQALLQQRLQSLETSFKALTENLSSTSPAVNDAESARLAALETEVTALKQQPAHEATALLPLHEQLQQLNLLYQGLSQRIEQQQKASQSMPDLRLLAVFQTLRARSLEGKAFESSLQRFLVLAQPYPLLAETAAPLEIYASSGRPLLPDLQRAFAEAVHNYMLRKDGTNNSLSAKIKANIAEFITIRRLDDTGNSALAILNRAEKLITQGEIESAALELNELPADSKPFFAPWLEEAKPYYEIPNLLLKLDQQLADTLMQPTGTGNAS